MAISLTEQNAHPMIKQDTRLRGPRGWERTGRLRHMCTGTPYFAVSLRPPAPVADRAHRQFLRAMHRDQI